MRTIRASKCKNPYYVFKEQEREEEEELIAILQNLPFLCIIGGVAK
jgi:hypothetical protein